MAVISVPSCICMSCAQQYTHHWGTLVGLRPAGEGLAGKHSLPDCMSTCTA